VSAQPSEQEVLHYFDKLSNWGRWGADDRLGTLNLITPERRLAGAALVRDGIVVSLSRDMDPESPDPLGRGTVLQRYMELDKASQLLGIDDPGFQAVREYVGIVPHGSHTHFDGLAHFSWRGKNYNGFDASDTGSTRGATSLSMHHAQDGILTRGILLDIPAVRGVPWLEPADPITPDDLIAAEERQGVTVGPGDGLLVYTGHFARIAAEGLHPQQHQPGLSASCLPFLHDRDVSVLGMDGIQDVMPSGYAAVDLTMPVHLVSLVAMGLWLIDNVSLTALASTCESRRQWEFFFAMLPWRMVGVTSSVVNPVAMF
jgi:kynurenine formamidase